MKKIKVLSSFVFPFVKNTVVLYLSVFVQRLVYKQLQPVLLEDKYLYNSKYSRNRNRNRNRNLIRNRNKEYPIKV